MAEFKRRVLREEKAIKDRLAEEPKDEKVLQRLVDVQLMKSDYEAVKATLRKMIDYFPEDYRYRLMLTEVAVSAAICFFSTGCCVAWLVVDISCGPTDSSTHFAEEKRMALGPRDSFWAVLGRLERSCNSTFICCNDPARMQLVLKLWANLQCM